jgi:hypothetical protein
MSIDYSDTKMVVSRYDINTSSASYSSVLGLVRQYMLSLFPPDFFKYIFIRNSVHSVTAAKDDDNSRMVNEKPNLAINMNLEPLQASFNGDAFILGNMQVLRNAWGYPHIYSRIAWDQNEKIYITALSIRNKFAFDISMQVNSEIQAINLQGYLRAKLGSERPVFLNKRAIEVPLPPSIIGTIASARKVDLSDPTQRIEFNTTLTKISDGRITYKLHKSSGKMMYFYRYATNLMFKVTSFDAIENEVENKSLLSSTVKFSIEVEYDAHVNFIVEAYQNLPPPVFGDYIFTDLGFSTVLHWTLHQVVVSQLDDGKKVAFATDIITDINDLMDITEFKPFMNPTVVKYIDSLETKEIKEQKLVPALFRDGVRLALDTIDSPGDFSVDWETYTLTVITPRLNYDYRFVVYADIGEVNAFNASLMPSANI